MTRVTDLEQALNRERYALRCASAMVLNLCLQDPPGFRVAVDVQGHFAMSSTYNQTHSDALNDALAVIVRRRLPELLREAEVVLREREAAATTALLIAALGVATAREDRA